MSWTRNPPPLGRDRQGPPPGTRAPVVWRGQRACCSTTGVSEAGVPGPRHLCHGGLTDGRRPVSAPPGHSAPGPSVALLAWPPLLVPHLRNTGSSGLPGATGPHGEFPHCPLTTPEIPGPALSGLCPGQQQPAPPTGHGFASPPFSCRWGRSRLYWRWGALYPLSSLGGWGASSLSVQPFPVSKSACPEWVRMEEAMLWPPRNSGRPRLAPRQRPPPSLLCGKGSLMPVFVTDNCQLPTSPSFRLPQRRRASHEHGGSPDGRTWRRHALWSRQAEPGRCAPSTPEVICVFPPPSSVGTLQGHWLGQGWRLPSPLAV